MLVFEVGALASAFILQFLNLLLQFSVLFVLGCTFEFMHLYHFLELLFLMVDQFCKAHFELLILFFIGLLELSVPLVVGKLLLLVLSPFRAHLLVMDLFEEVKFLAALALDLHSLFLELVFLLPVHFLLLAGLVLEIHFLIVVLGLSCLELGLVV